MNTPATNLEAIQYRNNVDFILDGSLFSGIDRKTSIFNDDDYEAYRRRRIQPEDAARALAEEFYFYAA